MIQGRSQKWLKEGVFRPEIVKGGGFHLLGRAGIPRVAG